jgi:hypothetical protein
MFKFQACHYYEIFSQRFCILWYVKTQRSQMSEKLHFKISYDVMLEYICAKNNISQHIKNCIYNQKRIEIIFSLYEICTIY